VHSNVSYAARLLAPDAERDLCLIGVENFHAASVGIAPLSTVKVGQRVLTIGSPFGRENTLSDGLVSGLSRNPEGNVTRIQISAPISHGSSGGGLFDMQGRLIGITSGGVDPSQAENINVAIPAEWIRDVPARAEAQLARRRELLAEQSAEAHEPRVEQVEQVEHVERVERVQTQRAPDYARATSQGVSVLVSSHAAWASRTCQMRFVPNISVVQSPTHGRLDIREGEFKIASRDAGPCMGQSINGAQVFYVPNADFKGRDVFSYVSSGNPSLTKTAVVEVR
jgi:hypothetical protein